MFLLIFFNIGVSLHSYDKSLDQISSEVSGVIYTPRADITHTKPDIVRCGTCIHTTLAGYSWGKSSCIKAKRDAFISDQYRLQSAKETCID